MEYDTCYGLLFHNLLKQVFAEAESLLFLHWTVSVQSHSFDSAWQIYRNCVWRSKLLLHIAFNV